MTYVNLCGFFSSLESHLMYYFLGVSYKKFGGVKYVVMCSMNTKIFQSWAGNLTWKWMWDKSVVAGLPEYGGQVGGCLPPLLENRRILSLQTNIHEVFFSANCFCRDQWKSNEFGPLVWW